MLILGINSSPRKGGNTDILLEYALSGAKAAGAVIKRINLGELKYSPCLSCPNQRKDGVCIVKDDMDEIYCAFEKADVVIIASPVYFGSVSAQLKMMIDRFQCAWTAKYVHKTVKTTFKKQGAFICVEASNKISFFENSRSIVKNLFVTLNIKYSKELLCSQVEDKGAILNKKDLLSKAEKLGKELINISL
ncbi:MAG: hypothetical protein A2452_07775 [Candidatus Firestonebacteria bacterium RIFOXYC2_FULL_39_67]|nr:MAG: hypothetical protein A2536_01795 [Candidatus Firestonebacteria bacterium RIFOXYD2_FULL_39_29]OGF52623.1 MAG: hypothetical protein A2497_07015 [Candidatus Firestonebacteria bacterium RifOxyC12_full_39_7]OGF53966.1 MAG: hypothetical protein A2452_07775 [Candidatus Firestonebacteria bacterium RIFOXYC2_FULL_39_67]